MTALEYQQLWEQCQDNIKGLQLNLEEAANERLKEAPVKQGDKVNVTYKPYTQGTASVPITATVYIAQVFLLNNGQFGYYFKGSKADGSQSTRDAYINHEIIVKIELCLK